MICGQARVYYNQLYLPPFSLLLISDITRASILFRTGTGKKVSQIRAIFLAASHDEPIDKFVDPKFCNGQYWPSTMVGASSMTN